MVLSFGFHYASPLLYLPIQNAQPQPAWIEELLAGGQLAEERAHQGRRVLRQGTAHQEDKEQQDRIRTGNRKQENRKQEKQRTGNRRIRNRNQENKNQEDMDQEDREQDIEG